jgi:hypothetical protein
MTIAKKGFIRKNKAILKKPNIIKSKIKITNIEQNTKIKAKSKCYIKALSSH